MNRNEHLSHKLPTSDSKNSFARQSLTTPLYFLFYSFFKDIKKKTILLWHLVLKNPTKASFKFSFFYKQSQFFCRFQKKSVEFTYKKKKYFILLDYYCVIFSSYKSTRKICLPVTNTVFLFFFFYSDQLNSVLMRGNIMDLTPLRDYSACRLSPGIIFLRVLQTTLCVRFNILSRAFE